MTKAITIVEVGPRDGFQSITRFVPTKLKIEMVQRLHEVGLRRIEVTSFVSPGALPQLADAPEVLVAANNVVGLDAQVLVPTEQRAVAALGAGARHIAFVLSVSEAHNRSNVRRSPAESVSEYARIAAMVPKGVKMRLNIATAFDCPFRGKVDETATLALLNDLVAITPEAEICLCDTTGRVAPDHVRSLFAKVSICFPEVHDWAFHAHDTFGVGVTNSLVAYESGISILDASFAGLGGCPFAPGATGNVATEDLVWMFENMGISTGINFDRLLAVAFDGAGLPGASVGGRVRDAMLAAARIKTSAVGHT
jgi:hydroxymethylglutaryl-CoA lyase